MISAGIEWSLNSEPKSFEKNFLRGNYPLTFITCEDVFELVLKATLKVPAVLSISIQTFSDQVLARNPP